MVAPSSAHRRRHSSASEIEPKPSSQMNLQTSRRTSIARPATPRLRAGGGDGGADR